VIEEAVVEGIIETERSAQLKEATAGTNGSLCV
jgi:hypothetical protein